MKSVSTAPITTPGTKRPRSGALCPSESPFNTFRAAARLAIRFPIRGSAAVIFNERRRPPMAASSLSAEINPSSPSPLSVAADRRGKNDRPRRAASLRVPAACYPRMRSPIRSMLDWFKGNGRVVMLVSLGSFFSRYTGRFPDLWPKDGFLRYLDFEARPMYRGFYARLAKEAKQQGLAVCRYGLGYLINGFNARFIDSSSWRGTFNDTAISPSLFSLAHR